MIFLKTDNFTKLSVKEILLTMLGTAILSFGVAVFIIPSGIVMGGVSGISLIINGLFPKISADLSVTVLTWLLFAFGAVVLGKDFALKTLVSAIVYPLGISVFSVLNSDTVFGGLFFLDGSPHGNVTLLISALFGGLLVGTGCAVAFIGGGSTGGADIIAFALCRRFKSLTTSSVIFIIDSVIIALGLAIIRDLIITLLGIIAAFVSALAVDKIFVGGQKAVTVQVVSDKADTLSGKIIENLGRTATLCEVVGGYSGRKKQMLTVSLTVSQYAELKKIIENTDTNAFVTAFHTHEIHGEGWTK